MMTYLTVFTGETWLTVACVAIDQIDAAAFIGAWILQTFINVNVTIFTSPSRFANTIIVVETINAFTVDTWL